MKFNLNNYVRVKLTPAGHQILKAKYGEIKINQNGWYQTQFWILMEDFGSHMNLGGPEPFDMNVELKIDSLELQLTRKEAEYKVLQQALSGAEGVPSVWLSVVQELAGDIAVLRERVAAEQDSSISP